MTNHMTNQVFLIIILSIVCVLLSVLSFDLNAQLFHYPGNTYLPKGHLPTSFLLTLLYFAAFFRSGYSQSGTLWPFTGRHLDQTAPYHRARTEPLLWFGPYWNDVYTLIVDSISKKRVSLWVLHFNLADSHHWLWILLFLSHYWPRFRD